MQQQNKKPTPSKSDSSKDNPSSVTDILALVISILDWLKNAGKSGDELDCPEVCEVGQAIEKLRDMTVKLESDKCGPKEGCICPKDMSKFNTKPVPSSTKKDPIKDKVDCDICCPGGPEGSSCKLAECDKCCKTTPKVKIEKRPSKDSGKVSENLAEEVTFCTPSGKPKEDEVSTDASKASASASETEASKGDVIVDKKPKETKECPSVVKLFSECSRCCQTIKSPTKDKPVATEKRPHRKKFCNCTTQPSEIRTTTRMNQSIVETDEKKIQAQQLKILYEQRKTLLDKMYAAQSPKYEAEQYVERPQIPTTTAQEIYKSLEPTYTASEDEDADDDDDDEACYDYVRPQLAWKALSPAKQEMQQPSPATYGSSYPQYASSLPYQTRTSPRNYYYAKSGISYQYYKPYQNYRYPLSRETSRQTSPTKVKCPYVIQTRPTLRECASTEESTPPTPTDVPASSPITEYHKYSPPADCAKRLIDAILQNPTCPAFEALKKATEPVNSNQPAIPSCYDDSRFGPNTTNDRNPVSQNKSASSCDKDCLGNPNKKGGLNPPR